MDQKAKKAETTAELKSILQVIKGTRLSDYLRDKDDNGKRYKFTGSQFKLTFVDHLLDISYFWALNFFLYIICGL